jgi:hypothetical protein
MRLHTDFRDYYDNAVGYGIDDNVHFNRFTNEVEIHIKSQYDFPRHRNAGLLGFCGKIYPFIEVKKFDGKYDDECASENYKIVEHYYAYNLEEYKSKESEWEDFSNDFGYYDHWEEIKLKQFFVDWDFQSDEVFLKCKVPVWVVKLDRNQNNGILNPKLKDYGFDWVKDSFTAFQEISMYLSNILIEQKETAIVEDKFRIEQHGFDLKKSFRREKK